MDSISSIFFPNEPLISWTQRWTFLDHFCHHFWVGLVLLCCCTHPKVMAKMAKKCSTLCSTDQRFILKRNTTYRIHTLAGLMQVRFFFLMNLWSVEHNVEHFLSSLLGEFGVALLLHPPKSDDKNGQEMFKEMFNWSEVHSEKKYYL